MTCITNYETHLEMLYRYTNLSNEIYISTGNIYAGITYFGSDTLANSSNGIRAWLDYLELKCGQVRTKILVAIPYYKSCKSSYCNDCAKEYVKLLLKMGNHANFFSNIEWYMAEHTYFKSISFNADQWRHILTTRNLTDMDENQCSIELAGSQIADKVKEDIAKAMPIDDEHIELVLEKSGIKDETVRSLING